jgi:hypothetical protein
MQIIIRIKRLNQHAAECPEIWPSSHFDPLLQAYGAVAVDTDPSPRTIVSLWQVCVDRMRRGRNSEAVALRYPVVPIANGLGI